MKIESEGDSVLTDPAGADLLVLRNPSGSKGFVQGFELPKLIVENLGYKPQEGPVEFMVSRWWDGGFGDQTLLSFPSFGTMNHGLGRQVCTGCASRYVETDLFEHLWGEKLKEYLGHVNHRGFVTLTLNGIAVGVTGVGVHLGLPYLSLFAFLENTKQSIAKVLTSPDRFFESWSVAVLISRAPYPEQEITPQSVAVTDIPVAAEKHLYLFPHKVSRKFPTFNGTRIAISTAWHASPHRANDYALYAAWDMNVPDKQFRTDVAQRAAEKFKSLSALL